MTALSRLTKPELLSRCRRLEAEVSELLSRINYGLHEPTMTCSRRGQWLLRGLLEGAMNKGNAPYPLLEREDLTIRMKFSKRVVSVPGRDSRKWAWCKPFGYKREPAPFDRLFLVGEPDPRYRSEYRDPSAEYVIFDLSRAEVQQIMDSMVLGVIQSSTRPKASSSCGWNIREFLFRRETTLDEISSRYGVPV